MTSSVQELFGELLPLDYYNYLANEIQRNAIAHEDEEESSCSPFTADSKDVINRQNQWPIVVNAPMAAEMDIL